MVFRSRQVFSATVTWCAQNLTVSDWNLVYSAYYNPWFQPCGKEFSGPVSNRFNGFINPLREEKKTVKTVANSSGIIPPTVETMGLSFFVSVLYAKFSS